MSKSRRDFLKKLPLAMSVPFTLGGLPFKALGQNMLTKMAKASTNEKVLVILQMHGGNDGLNCVIPVADYADYYTARPNVAIPTPNKTRGYIALDSTLPESKQVGLHPDMLAMKHLYDIGSLHIVQGVSYPDNNGSHFRGRDINFMGGSANDYLDSGWLGRYLQQEYAPDIYPEQFPTATMKDPLALEIGSETSLIFHQGDNIPTSISLFDIEGFHDLVVNDLEGFEEAPKDLDSRGIPPANLSNSPYFKELQWILDLEEKSEDYADILLKRYKDGGATNVQYPDLYPLNAPAGSKHNPLSYQLKMVARLLGGNCKTKVFLVKIGGFDTHADQVEKYDTTMGSHAASMYHISTAMAAFQKDLKARGLDDMVLTVTTSEFGRRVKSNGSYGTDHGTASPMFIFGRGAKPGVTGDAFVTDGDNLAMQNDYRNVYANIMKDWMGLTGPEGEARLDVIFPGLMSQAGTSDGQKFSDLQLASQNITGVDEFIGDRFALKGFAPNPAKEKTFVHFKVNAAFDVVVDMHDINGKKVKVMVNGFYGPGEHKVEVDLTGIPTGTYICELRTGSFRQTKKLMIVK